MVPQREADGEKLRGPKSGHGDGRWPWGTVRSGWNPDVQGQSRCFLGKRKVNKGTRSFPAVPLVCTESGRSERTAGFSRAVAAVRSGAQGGVGAVATFLRNCRCLSERQHFPSQTPVVSASLPLQYKVPPKTVPQEESWVTSQEVIQDCEPSWPLGF